MIWAWCLVIAGHFEGVSDVLDCDVVPLSFWSLWGQWGRRNVTERSIEMLMKGVEDVIIVPNRVALRVHKLYVLWQWPWLLPLKEVPNVIGLTGLCNFLVEKIVSGVLHNLVP